MMQLRAPLQPVRMVLRPSCSDIPAGRARAQRLHCAGMILRLGGTRLARTVGSMRSHGRTCRDVGRFKARLAARRGLRSALGRHKHGMGKVVQVTGARRGPCVSRVSTMLVLSCVFWSPGPQNRFHPYSSPPWPSGLRGDANRRGREDCPPAPYAVRESGGGTSRARDRESSSVFWC